MDFSLYLINLFKKDLIAAQGDKSDCTCGGCGFDERMTYVHYSTLTKSSTATLNTQRLKN